MDNIILFYGPYDEFKKHIPQNFTNLTDYIYQSDKRHKDIRIYQNTDSYSYVPEKIDILNLVAFSEDYANLNEHAIQAFASLLAEDNITNVYLQNPPYRTTVPEKWTCILWYVLRDWNSRPDYLIVIHNLTLY